MAGTIFFLVVFIVPLGIYALNAWASRRPRGIAGPMERPGPKEPRQARPPRQTQPPRRSRARVRPANTADCGRGWTHLWLSLAGARSACRHCAELQAAAETPAPGEPAAPDTPAPPVAADVPIAPEAADALAEVERLLDDKK